ncbi:hypothetical protein BGP75_04985 [Motiliproteus sp. MSK22-1]|nr:hypothetical protein BGP75_04985 [Motiliproteus sp. MSK22-1]
MTKTSPQSNHPDIEIYLKSVPIEQIETWLKQRFDSIENLKQSRKVKHYLITHSDQQIPVMVVENASKAFSSILFESDASPWAQDIDCAREAYQYFSKETRCIASGWNDGDEPDEWIAIDSEGEKNIIWKT